MQQSTLLTLFYLKRAKVNTKGVCPILCRITYKKQRKQFSTGLSICPEHWFSKEQKAKHPKKDYDYINEQLESIAYKINKAYLSLKLSEDEFSVVDIFTKYLNKTTQKDENVISYFKAYLLKIKALIGKDIKESTWNKFNYVCNNVQGFIKYKYRRADIPLKKLNLLFLEDLEYYYKTKKNFKQVTINKEIQRLRKPIKIAVAEGYLDKDPFALYKPGRIKKEVVFLTKEELEAFEQKTFMHPKLQLVKDLFVFCCYTGLPYYEMSMLESKHIEVGFDSNKWIRIKRNKTSKELAVPLLKKAVQILNKYKNHNNGEKLLPKISNQKFNVYLKEIALILEIDKRITHHTARKTFASTVLLYNNVPIEIVSTLLGHSSIKITEDYYGKVVQKKVSEAMKNLEKI